MKVGDNSVKKKKRNSLCNLKGNIIIGLTTIKIVRGICQDFSKTTVFGEYTKKENTYESADHTEEEKIH